MTKTAKKVEPTGPIYPAIPELGWLKELTEGVTDDLLLSQYGERLWDLYKWILWSRRYHLSEPNGQPRLVAYGFIVKYHSLVFDEPMNPANAKAFEMAKIGYKKLKEERRT